jgi:hypothetical protein
VQRRTVPVIKPEVPALTEHRLIGVEKGYFHGEGIAAASARLVETQARIDITKAAGLADTLLDRRHRRAARH